WCWDKRRKRLSPMRRQRARRRTRPKAAAVRWADSSRGSEQASQRSRAPAISWRARSTVTRRTSRSSMRMRRSPRKARRRVLGGANIAAIDDDGERRQPLAVSGTGNAGAIRHGELRAVASAQDVLSLKHDDAPVKPLERKVGVWADIFVGDNLFAR